jgi:hypothetical protein
MAACIECLGLLAAVAAGRRDPDRAGHLWGSVEAEEANGPLGHGWEDEDRPMLEAMLSGAAGPTFESGRTRGLKLPLAEAVAYALAGRNGTLHTSGEVSR